MQAAFRVFALLAALAARHEAATVSLCDLVKNPAAYDKKIIEITAFVSHGFEDFTLFDPRCSSGMTSVWLEYGGKLSSGTMYCCGVGRERSREKPLVVDGVETTLVQDEKLKQFDALLQREPDTVVRATLRGRFFAGKEMTLPGGKIWGGYGHFGMYTLLAIEQIVAVDPHDLPDVDYGSAPSYPEDEAGCYRESSGSGRDEAIERQHQAEAGASSAFDNPMSVAAQYLSAVRSEPVDFRLELAERAPGRLLYKATSPDSPLHYWVIVSRPYWLTFFAKDRRRIAWTPIGSRQVGCP